MDETPLRRQGDYDQQSPAQQLEMLDQPSPRGAHDTPQHSPALRLMLKEVVETVVFILLAFFIVRGMVQNFKIEGRSMDPTLHDGQYILVNKLIYFHFDMNAPLRLLPGNEDLLPSIVYPFHMPRRGDIIVFHAPSERRDYIKRVIGMPGEHIAIRDGKVYINDQLLDEPYLTSTTSCDGLRPSCDTIVPPGAIYVMGDNRPNSSDSRMWQALPLDNVIGQAWLSYWPQEYWGVIPTHSYAFGSR